jgi:DNA-binding response OmpR family regulator
MNRKILIIDDDIDLVEALRMTLENAGFEVIDAQDGKKGVEKVRKENPDLVILDVMMGSQDEGFFVAYELKNSSDFADLPIIMLTAVGQETGFNFDKNRDEDFLPVNDFIEKPVSPEKLIEVVKINLGF